MATNTIIKKKEGISLEVKINVIKDKEKMLIMMLFCKNIN